MTPFIIPIMIVILMILYNERNENKEKQGNKEGR